MNIQTIMMVSTVVIAVATLIYASLTYFLLREQRREKEKPRIQEIGEVVICPLIEKLEKQKNSFSKGDFNWTQNGLNYKQHQLAEFRGMEKLIYEDFLKAYRDIASDVERYNQELNQQKVILDNFANEIRKLSDFKEYVYEKFEKYPGRTHNKNMFTSEVENLEYILKCIVNNKQELKETNSYHEFWDQYGEDLLKFRNKGEIKNYKAEVENGCIKLLDSADSILKKLKKILDDYREKYGINYKELLKKYPPKS